MKEFRGGYYFAIIETLKTLKIKSIQLKKFILNLKKYLVLEIL